CTEQHSSADRCLAESIETMLCRSLATGQRRRTGGKDGWLSRAQRQPGLRRQADRHEDTDMKRLLVIDGHAYAYRPFHAIHELRSPSGAPTNAIYGFIKMLGKLRSKAEPSHLIVVWDGGLCAERMMLLPEYKAQRPEMPADLSTQLDEIGFYLTAAGIPSFCQ